MKALVIGGGGREHALAWKLAQGERVQAVFVAPGNAGTAAEPHVRNVAITDLEELAAFAVEEKIDLTVVGPEAALAAGAVDIFRARGLRIFGPTKAAAELESSKAFAKDFMRRHAIPTAAYEVFEDAQAARRRVDAAPLPIVVKADGLAAGKGVVVAATREEAHAAVESMLGASAPAGSRVVDRGVSRRRGGELHRRLRRQERAAARDAARTTSGSATAIAAPTPAAWARTRPRRW